MNSYNCESVCDVGIALISIDKETEGTVNSILSKYAQMAM